MKGNLKELIRKRIYEQVKKELNLPAYNELWIKTKKDKNATRPS